MVTVIVMMLVMAMMAMADGDGCGDGDLVSLHQNVWSDHDAQVQCVHLCRLIIQRNFVQQFRELLEDKFVFWGEPHHLLVRGNQPLIMIFDC